MRVKRVVYFNCLYSDMLFRQNPNFCQLCELFIVFSSGETDGRDLSNLEELVWTPENPLSDREIDQFMVIAR